MFDWKQRLYAFLLRRILGPWLDSESNQQLHESIELVSLQQGKLVLTNVGLNTFYLTQKLLKLNNKTRRRQQWSNIVKARMGRLEITLSLQEQQQQQPHNEPSSSSRAETGDSERCSSNPQQQQQQTQSSLAWRTLKLGSTALTSSSNETTSSPTIALVVNVVIDGICIEVEPNQDDDHDTDDTDEEEEEEEDAAENAAVQENGNNSTTTQVAVAKGMLSSYIDAALSSLRLTVKVNRLTIRTWSKSNSNSSHQQEQQKDWVELVVKSISYHDVNRNHHHHHDHHHHGDEQSKNINANSAVVAANADAANADATAAAAAAAASAALEHSQQQSSLYETVMHKALDITRISITTGRSGCSSSSSSDLMTTTTTATITTLVALVEGTSMIRIRAIQYQQEQQQQQQAQSSSSSQQSSSSQLQQDVELTIGQKVNFLVNQQALLQIQRVLQSYQPPPTPTSPPAEQQQQQHQQHHHLPPATIHSTKANDKHHHHQQQQQQQQLDGNIIDVDDTADLKTIEGIMQQYHQARLLAERNPVRGGILLPSESTGTLDAFFDANESSFHRYSTILLHQHQQQQSTMLTTTTTPRNENDTDVEDDDAAAAAGMDFVHSKIKCHLVGLSAKIILIGDKDSTAATPSSSSSLFSSPAIPVWRQHQRLLQPDEYILLTFTDLNLSTSQSLRTSTYTLGITHVEIEDSLLVVANTKNNGSSSDKNPPLRAEIGSILSFTTLHENDDENFLHGGGGGCEQHNNNLLCQAPVLSMDITTTRSSSSTEKVQLDLSLEPMQLTLRLAVASKLSRMLSEITAVNHDDDDDDDEYSEMENYMGNHESTSPEQEVCHYRQETTRAPVAPKSTPPPKKSNLCARISCPSVDVLLPVSCETNHDWSALYKRCGYHGYCSLTSAITRPCLGFHFDNPMIQMGGAGVGKNKRQQDLIMTTDPALVVSCQHVIFFALLPPLFSPVAAQRRLVPRQFDILALAGRSTVDPVSILVYRNLQQAQKQSNDAKESSLDNVATRAFPMTPPISSFKARQDDDDDEEDNVDASCSSIGDGGDNDVPVATRQEMRGSDPQPRMVEETASSSCVVEIRIPDFSCDVSTQELSAIQAMVNGIQSSSSSKSNSSAVTDHEENAASSPTATSLSERMSISFACDSIALAIRGSPNISTTANTTQKSDNESQSRMFAYIVRADTLRAHTLLESGKSFRHVRFLVHEVDFFEMQDDDCALLQQQEHEPTTAEDRSNILGQRIRQSSYSASVTPIVYRSHLFSPISRQSPCILIDILDTTKILAGTSDCAFVERKVYATLYDVTYRYDFDSCWISVLQSIFKKPENGTKTETCESSIHVPVKDSLTRVFFSITDCNFDYSSCRRFQTASRIIARFGDLRITSNILSPAPSVQAFKLSLGDFSIYLCNSRYPYNFENSRLLDADALLKPGQVEHSQRDSVTCLRAMNYRTIVLLDSADAVIAIAKGQPKKPTDPWVKTTLSLGEVGVFACKDSFHLFLQSIGEFSAEATALNNRAFDELKREPPFILPLSKQDAQPRANGIRKSTLHPSVVETTLSIQRQHDFLLDGYDWTTVAQGGPTPLGIPPGEEQSARWYGENGALTTGPPLDKTDVPSSRSSLPEDKDAKSGVHFIAQHFPVHQATDPLVDGDMSAAKHAGTSKSPRVQSRLVVQNMRLKLRFFDGYDWPETLNPKLRNLDRHRAFIIEQPAEEVEPADKDTNRVHDEEKHGDRKADLMADLLNGPCEKNDTFQDTPLPEERGARLKEKADLLRLARRTDKYIQISASGITVRSDSLAKTDDHILASCLYIKAQDFFMAETISRNKPVKMIGEWFNEVEHPRDTKSGLVCMKMVTWHAAKRITDENEIASDECEATVKLLPLRCVLDQRAIRFTSSFFQSPTSGNDDENEPGPALPEGLHAIPPPLFRLFRIRPFKLKVDYKPEKLDAQALRNGQIVELINLSPLDGMILQLQQVQAVNKVGFGAVIGEAVGCWIRDICSTQLLKFLTSSRPLEPITNVGGGISDLIVLPWEAFQNGESVKKAMRSGARSFARSLAYETFTISSGLTEFVAAKTAAATCFDPLYNASTNGTNVSGGHGGVGGGGYSSNGHHGHGGMMLPMRPMETPGIFDIGPHALESLSRGIATANYKIVVIPYREYRRSGTTGAVRSVLKGIPVAIAAPASGAAEALSFTLLGVRNSLRPDIRKEEEVSLRGLRLDGS